MTLVYDTHGKLDLAQADHGELRRELAAVDLWEHIVELNAVINDPENSEARKVFSKIVAKKFKGVSNPERERIVTMEMQRDLPAPELIKQVLEEDLKSPAGDDELRAKIRDTVFYQNLKNFTSSQVALLGTIRQNMNADAALEVGIEIYSNLYEAAMLSLNSGDPASEFKHS